MRTSESPVAFVANRMRGRKRPAPNARDKIVLRKFGAVAKVLWPDKTAAHIAAIGDADERTGKRWIRGEQIPPAIVVLACMHEMLRPED